MPARVRRSGDNVTFEFPFASATPAAVFRRGETLWLVFASEDAIAVAPLEGEIGRSIKGVSRTRARDAVATRPIDSAKGAPGVKMDHDRREARVLSDELGIERALADWEGALARKASRSTR